MAERFGGPGTYGYPEGPDCWVLELGSSAEDRPRYWNGENPLLAGAWSEEIEEAVRFVTKNDAARVASGILRTRATRFCQRKSR